MFKILRFLSVCSAFGQLWAWALGHNLGIRVNIAWAITTLVAFVISCIMIGEQNEEEKRREKQRNSD